MNTAIRRRTRQVNDFHSQLNQTRIAALRRPHDHESLCDAVEDAWFRDLPVSLAGGRGAMGGQQFLTDGLLIEMRAMNRLLSLDPVAGLAQVQAGATWPELIDQLAVLQHGVMRPWVIRQKQTGADRLTLGGALAANNHGRGLTLPPFVNDVESFLIVGPDGRTQRCSRTSNADLFRLAVGGYGLFGAVSSIQLRLVRRQRVKRTVELTTVDRLAGAFAERIEEGHLYGDFQFAIDPNSEDFLNKGILSCYRPAGHEVDSPAARILSEQDWRKLLLLAHTDKRLAFELYARHYLSTDGQCYWSDTHQLSPYVDGYHRVLDSQLGLRCKASEMITEIYVPRDRLARFLKDVGDDFRRHGGNLIYGTIRLIEQDRESFLAWARQPWACVIFNLCTLHDRRGLAHSAAAFRRLIERGIQHGGSYYLTYHRWASRRQVLRCHPRLPELLRLKERRDPTGRFQSNWYRHYRTLLGVV